MALNVGQELAQRKHPIRDISLKYRISGKYNNGMYDVRLEEFEEFPDGTNMPVVLAYRVLELNLARYSTCVQSRSLAPAKIHPL